jgi:hypothetical protein
MLQTQKTKVLPEIVIVKKFPKEKIQGCKIRGRRCLLPTITGIMYLDMFQQFLIPDLDDNKQEERIHF